MLPVGPVNFPLTRPKNSCSLYFFLFLHEEDRICLTTLSGADRTKTLNSNSPPQLEMVGNGPQSLDANDVMVNARGLPGGDVEDSNRPFPSFPGLCFKTRVGAQPLIWKSFFILLQMKLIFTRKIVHVASFWKWGFLELGSGLLIGALQAGRQSERGTGPELRVGAHYRSRKWEAKDFEKVYTVVCGTPNYLFWRRNLINSQTNTLTQMTS